MGCSGGGERERRGRGEGGECVENVTHGLPWRLKETLLAGTWGLKKGQSGELGAVEGAENSSQNRPLLATLSQVPLTLVDEK